MISIIVIIFLARHIGRVAKEKNEHPLKWKLRAIFAWLIGDFLGEMIIIYFFGFDVVLLTIFGPGMGYLGYLFVKQNLDKI